MFLDGLEDTSGDDESFGRIRLLAPAIGPRPIRRSRDIHPDATVGKQVSERPRALQYVRAIQQECLGRVLWRGVESLARESRDLRVHPILVRQSEGALPKGITR